MLRHIREMRALNQDVAASYTTSERAMQHIRSKKIPFGPGPQMKVMFDMHRVKVYAKI